MAKRFQLTLLKNGVTASAELLEDSAPKTCEAVWKSLPMEEEAVHGAWSGECIYFQHEIPITEREIQTMYVAPGEIGMNLPQHDPPRPKRPEIQIYYGRAQPRWQRGPTPVIVFARIVENLQSFATECRTLQKAGVQRVRCARA